MTVAAVDRLSYARRLLSWIKQLPDEDRRTALVAVVYQELRRTREPFYRVLPSPGKRAEQSRNFKTFATIRKWLEAIGWTVALQEPGWQNYLAYVFDQFCPETRPDALAPAPGQLKHPLLLKKFLNDTKPDGSVIQTRSQEALANLYAEIEAMRDA